MARFLLLFLISSIIISWFWLIKLVTERFFYIKSISQLQRDIKRLEQEIKLIK